MPAVPLPVLNVSRAWKGSKRLGGAMIGYARLETGKMVERLHFNGVGRVCLRWLCSYALRREFGLIATPQFSRFAPDGTPAAA